MAVADAISVLVVDDEEPIRDFLDMALDEDEGFVVVGVGSVAEAIAALERQKFDLALLDKNLPDGTGLDVARVINERNLDMATVMITAYANMESAVEAMRLNISDYLEKPMPDVDALLTLLRRVIKMLKLERANRDLIAQLKDKNERLEAMAVKDPLTGLFNHAYLQDAIGRELARAKRVEGASCSLLFVDLDKFKQVNDTLGHASGDRLLRLVAELFGRAGREADLEFRAASEGVTARYGGDEFALLLPDTNKAGAATRAERLRETISAHDFSDEDLPPQSISIGCATYPEDAENRGDLIKAAGLALYAAKHSGRDRMVSYRSALSELRGQDSGEAELEVRQQEALDRSIAEMKFRYFYQPIVHSDSGEPFAYEALVRPQDEAFPNPFVLIQAAERCGKIIQLGRALRECSLSNLGKFPKETVLFINLHPQELYDPDFLAIESFVKPWVGQLVFEITEVAGIRDHDRVRKIAESLRRAGARIALDDLGSGYSGLNSLSLLQPDIVKLDMHLIRQLSTDERTRRLVKHIIEFSRGEGMQVVAEGIETEEERSIVSELGADLLQGYFFSKPKPVEELL